MRHSSYARMVDGTLWPSYFVHCSLCRPKRVSPRTYRFNWTATRAARRHESMHRHPASQGMSDLGGML